MGITKRISRYQAFRWYFIALLVSLFYNFTFLLMALHSAYIITSLVCVCVFRWRASHFEIQYNDIRRDPNGISVNEITQFMSICNIFFSAFRVNFISKPYALQHNKIKPIKHPYPPPEWTGDTALQLIDIKVYALRIEWVSSLHTHAQFSLWLHALCALIALTAVRMMPFFGSIISFTPFVAVVFCF